MNRATPAGFAARTRIATITSTITTPETPFVVRQFYLSTQNH